jgi:hypothetical protein
MPSPNRPVAPVPAAEELDHQGYAVGRRNRAVVHREAHRALERRGRVTGLLCQAAAILSVWVSLNRRADPLIDACPLSVMSAVAKAVYEKPTG